jgi:hypothetical protein
MKKVILILAGVALMVFAAPIYSFSQTANETEKATTSITKSDVKKVDGKKSCCSKAHHKNVKSCSSKPHQHKDGTKCDPAQCPEKKNCDPKSCHSKKSSPAKSEKEKR